MLTKIGRVLQLDCCTRIQNRKSTISGGLCSNFFCKRKKCLTLLKQVLEIGMQDLGKLRKGFEVTKLCLHSTQVIDFVICMRVSYEVQIHIDFEYFQIVWCMKRNNRGVRTQCWCTVWKKKKKSIIRQKYFVKSICSEDVIFTKFLSKKCESKFLQF